MLRTRNEQPTLWESILPEELLRLPAELARVDALLDDERFFAPFRAYFDPLFGRPSIPTETYLRLMFLKFRYRLGYESVCAEVADSIGWRRFTRIGIDGKVPHPTTLMKITTRCGSEVIEQLNEALLAKATEGKLLRVGNVRQAGQGHRRGHRHPLPGSHPRRRATRPPDRLEAAATRRAGQGRSSAGSPASHRRAGPAGFPQRRRRAGGPVQRPPCSTHRHRPPRRATAPRRQRAGYHDPGHHRRGGPGPLAVGRRDARRRRPGGQPARPRRPPDRAGPAGPAGRVRLQGPGLRQ